MTTEATLGHRLPDANPGDTEIVLYPAGDRQRTTAVFVGDKLEDGWSIEGHATRRDGRVVYRLGRWTSDPGQPGGMQYQGMTVDRDVCVAANAEWENQHPPLREEFKEDSGEVAVAAVEDNLGQLLEHDPLNDDMIVDPVSGEYLSPEDYYARKRARDAAVDVAPKAMGLGSREKLRGLIESKLPSAGSRLRQFELTTDPNKALKNVLEGLHFILDSLEDSSGPGKVSAEDLVHISSMLKNTPRSGNSELDAAVQDLDSVCMQLNLDVHSGADQKLRIEKLYELYEIIKKGSDALQDHDVEASESVGEETSDPSTTTETPVLDELDAVEPSVDTQQEQERDDARADIAEALEASGEEVVEGVDEPQVAEEAISQAEAGIDEPSVDGPQEQTRLDAREDIEGAFTQPEAEPAIPVEQSSGEAQPDQAPDEGEPQEMSEQEREALVEYDKKIAATAQGILEIGSPEELRERGNKMDRVSAGLDALQQNLGSPQSIINEQPLIHSLIRNIAELKEDNDGYLRSDQVVVGRAQEVEGTKNQSSMDFAGKMISKQAQDQARNLLPAVDSIVGQMTYEAVSINNVTHMIEERLKSLSKILSEMAQPRHDQGVEVYAHIIRNNVLEMRELASAYKSNANRIRDIHAGAGALLASVAK